MEQKRKPVLDKHGKLENFTIRIAGERFRCDCRCNVFNKPDDRDLNLYQCNSCRTEYQTE
ncbi:hypothetical protein HMPREF1487_04379 [Pseudomonas sp. HPB0071]|nr:hypothetical protein HMPREF1487_04379 [Pseudomonas sp. HPB0071]